jgi:hypothetical protein
VGLACGSGTSVDRSTVERERGAGAGERYFLVKSHFFHLLP